MKNSSPPLCVEDDCYVREDRRSHTVFDGGSCITSRQMYTLQTVIVTLKWPECGIDAKVKTVKISNPNSIAESARLGAEVKTTR